MSMGSGKWLVYDGQSTTGTYRPILTICIFAAPQRVVMNVGNNGASVRSFIPDLGHDCVNF